MCSAQAWVMMKEISDLIYSATEEQVVRARNQLKASILFQQDGPGGVCSVTPLRSGLTGKPEMKSHVRVAC